MLRRIRHFTTTHSLEHQRCICVSHEEEGERGRAEVHHAYINLPLGFEAIFPSHINFAQLDIRGESHGRLEHLNLAIDDRQYATRFDMVDLLAPQREQYSTCCITNLKPRSMRTENTYIQHSQTSAW